jgi:SGNH hydrolase-like domain, acetyltransferase AlgX
MTQPAITTPAVSILSAPEPARRWLRWLSRGAMMCCGLALGVAAAEGVFAYRDGGALPHLNVYVADAELGVRLLPGATQKVAFGGNPITSVRINGDGYRGGELPAPGKDDVLVVGDSQVFGLGVEEGETFSARLGAASGRPVMNGGVPTYGPAEYRAVISEQLAKRHPKTVVLTINLVNDLFEVQHLNKDRHAVWDGWAVRKETAPAATTRFPGRDLLYRRSHLFFALRKWRHGEDRTAERGVVSEGTWRDLVTTGAQVEGERRAIDDARHKRLAEMTTAHHEIEGAEQAIDEKIRSILGEATFVDSFALETARANPGDIVQDGFGEGSRSSVATADQIAAAATIRAQLRQQLARWAKAHNSADAKEALASLAASDGALARLTQLDVEKLTTALEPPLGAYLRDVQQLVEHAGARLVVVILPIDVQVSADEWKKYGATPIDMAPSKALTTELVALCRTLGVSVLDATPVLAQAEPGAFLDKDIHMTPRGHAAVAAALGKTIAEPAPVREVASERSPVPLPDVFKHAPEVIVSGSSDAACETKQVREWLRIQCPRSARALPVDVEITRDDGHEAMVLVMPAEISLVVPVVLGRELAATLTWTDKTRVLHVAWPAGAKRPTLAFDKPIARGKPIELDVFATPMKFRSPVERAICDCWQVVFGGQRYRNSEDVFTCAGAYGAPDPACVEKYYRTDASCPELLACTRRDPASPR